MPNNFRSFQIRQGRVIKESWGFRELGLGIVDGFCLFIVDTMAMIVTMVIRVIRHDPWVLTKNYVYILCFKVYNVNIYKKRRKRQWKKEIGCSEIVLSMCFEYNFFFHIFHVWVWELRDIQISALYLVIYICFALHLWRKDIHLIQSNWLIPHYWLVPLKFLKQNTQQRLLNWRIKIILDIFLNLFIKLNLLLDKTNII